MGARGVDYDILIPGGPHIISTEHLLRASLK